MLDHSHPHLIEFMLSCCATDRQRVSADRMSHHVRTSLQQGGLGGYYFLLRRACMINYYAYDYDVMVAEVQ